MDFAFSDEQKQLAESVRRLIEKDYGFDARKRLVAGMDAAPSPFWGRLVELGLTALPLPSGQGGFDGTAIDLLPVMIELGRGMIAEPFFATIVAAECVRHGGNDAALGVLEEVAEGRVRMSFAFGERGARHDLGRIDLRAAASGDGFRLTGEKVVVPFGAQVDRLVVSARTDGGVPALFLVPTATAGVTRTDHRTLDGNRVADIGFDGVVVGRDALLARASKAETLLDAVTDYAVALLCAEAVGAMEALNAATLEYAKTRKQFGQPIARFQALQHRMVDMFMHLEQARSMAYLAAVRCTDEDAVERRRVVSAAKVRIGQAARFIGQQAVQIHGGMGVTNELPAAHLFKRLTMIELTLGDTDHHLRRFIAASREAAMAKDGPSVAMPRAA